MKVIARGKNGPIVEMTDDELARVAGRRASSEYPSSLTTKSSYGRHEFDIGVELKVNEVWDAAQIIRARPERLELLSKSLRDAADTIDSCNRAIASPFAPQES